MKEFDLITTLLRPLVANVPGALALQDDAAYIHPSTGNELIISQDSLVESVHFLSHSSASDIARRVVRTSISDIAAMGGIPRAILLSMMLSQQTSSSWIEGFVNGLREELSYFNIDLLGGDTVSHEGKHCFTVSALGEAPKGEMLTRHGAKPGDDIYVTGIIGYAALGFALANNELGDVEKDITRQALDAFHRPVPRFEVGQALRGVASSCIDVSDGLVQDAGHICFASQVGMELEIDAIPIPKLDIVDWTAGRYINFGDDYELLFTAPASVKGKLETIQQSLSLPITAIGKVVDGDKVKLYDSAKQEISLDKAGFQHRFG